MYYIFLLFFLLVWFIVFFIPNTHQNNLILYKDVYSWFAQYYIECNDKLQVITEQQLTWFNDADYIKKSILKIPICEK